jgi:hypothetical protein
LLRIHRSSFGVVEAKRLGVKHVDVTNEAAEARSYDSELLICGTAVGVPSRHRHRVDLIATTWGGVIIHSGGVLPGGGTNEHELRSQSRSCDSHRNVPGGLYD